MDRVTVKEETEGKRAWEEEQGKKRTAMKEGGGNEKKAHLLSRSTGISDFLFQPARRTERQSSVEAKA